MLGRGVTGEGVVGGRPGDRVGGGRNERHRGVERGVG